LSVTLTSRVVRVRTKALICTCCETVNGLATLDCEQVVIPLEPVVHVVIVTTNVAVALIAELFVVFVMTMKLADASDRFASRTDWSYDQKTVDSEPDQLSEQPLPHAAPPRPIVVWRDMTNWSPR